jgi:hypothetical protein
MKNKVNIITDEVLQTTGFVYLILMVIDSIKVGFVSDYFDPKFLLIVILITLIIKIIFGDSANDILIKKNKINRLYILFLSVISGSYCYFKTKELGLISIFLTILAIIVIWFSSYLSAFDKDTDISN